MNPMLSGDVEPGVVRSAESLADLRADAERYGWDFRLLTGPSAGSWSKEETLESLGAALGFPEGFGRNLDALWDSLRDLEEEPVVLVWQGSDALDSTIFEPIIDVLQERAEQGGFAVILTES